MEKFLGHLHVCVGHLHVCVKRVGESCYNINFSKKEFESLHIHPLLATCDKSPTSQEKQGIMIKSCAVKIWMTSSQSERQRVRSNS